MALVVIQTVGSTAVATTPENNQESADARNWDALLDARTLRRILVAPSGDRDADVARAAEIIEAVATRHRDLIPPERIDSLTASVYFAEVDRVYRHVVLEPLSAVSEKEIRAYFDAHREGFRRPAGAKLLEIFMWAPEDLPELRTERLAVLAEIQEKARDEEGFSAAAERHSDATSFQNGGRIGTLMADQVNDRLQSVIFGDGTGPTEIISTSEGHYLFLVVNRVRPRERSFDDVAGRITNRLRFQTFETARKRDDERLTERYSIDLDPKEGVFSIAGTSYTLATARLSADLEDSKLDSAVRRRAHAIAREVELKTMEIEIAIPSGRLAMALYEVIYPALLKTRIEAAPPEPATGGKGLQPPKPPRTIQRWDFEMLTLPDDGGQNTLFALLRTRHDLHYRSAMKEVRAVLRERYGLTAEVMHRTGLLAPDAAAMGPEIYRTLKHHLQIGEISRPLHLEDSHRFVVVRLTGRTLDVEAGVQEQALRVRSRIRRSIRAALETELLEHTELRGGNSSDDLLESQWRQ